MPIEVKSGSSGRLRSLIEFMKSTGGKTAIRVYDGRLTEEKITAGDIKFRLLSVPFYLLRGRWNWRHEVGELSYPMS